MKERKYVIQNEKARQWFISHLLLIDLEKPKRVVISDYRKTRSNNQNSLYWCWMHEIGNDTGHTADELHEFFKRQFLPPQSIELNGHVIDVPLSTTKLTTVDFMDYMERIKAFAGTELQLMLTAPEPDQWTS